MVSDSGDPTRAVVFVAMPFSAVLLNSECVIKRIGDEDYNRTS